MKVIVEYGEEQILLKKYASYLDLDKDLSQFKSLEELISSLNLDEEDIIRILDNNGNQIPFNSDVVKKTISLYENNKGDEFINMIIDSARENDRNRFRLKLFFDDRYLDFTKNKNNFSINDIKNSEGKKLFMIICSIRSSFDMYGDNPGYFELYKNVFAKQITEYVKKDGEFNYGYMRKLGVSLVNCNGFSINNLDVKDNTKSEDKDKVLREYETSIHNHNYSKKQIAINDLPLDDNKQIIYDENGIKLDEKEFLEEFNSKKKLHL